METDAGTGGDVGAAEECSIGAVSGESNEASGAEPIVKMETDGGGGDQSQSDPVPPAEAVGGGGGEEGKEVEGGGTERLEEADPGSKVKTEEDAPAAANVVVKEEPAPAASHSDAAPPAVEAAVAGSAGADQAAAVNVDLSSLGKGGGLIGDDEDQAFVPQASAMPSLAQYTSKAKDAHSKIERNSYDVESWKILISEVQSGSMKHLAGEVYERLLEVFPTSGRHWLSYTNTFVAENRKAKAIEVLQRALPHCPHVDLWRAFLIHFVGITKDQSEVAKAYERAVESVGQDIAANAVWNDYINFLKNAKVATQYEKSQSMFQLRRAYHRALLVPMHQMERLWCDYEVSSS